VLFAFWVYFQQIIVTFLDILESNSPAAIFTLNKDAFGNMKQKAKPLWYLELCELQKQYVQNQEERHEI